MKNNRKLEENRQTYWQSTTDLMSGLLLLLLLIVMLFMVRILYISEYDGEQYEEIKQNDNLGDYNYETGYNYLEHNSGQSGGYDGGGSSNGYDRENSTGDYDTDYTKNEPGYGAVLVKTYDTYSDKQVTKPGIQYELRDGRGAVVSLTTYYPEKNTYRIFETDDNGTFFLPDKLKMGFYTLRNIGIVEGYDLAEDIAFEVDKEYEWNDPLIVRAYVGIEKNKLLIQLIDENGEKVRESVNINIFSYNDIVTDDGIVRHFKNDMVGSITTDNSGYGESDELFLGEYLLEVDIKSDVYASNKDNVVTLYSRNAESGRAVKNVVAQKTEIEIRLLDELRDFLPLQGAEYELRNTKTGETKLVYTDYDGFARFSDLAKETTYEIKQTGEILNYYPDPSVYQLYVDSNGLIEKEAVYRMDNVNRIIRIGVDVTDSRIKRSLDGYNVDIYDSSDKLVASFLSAGSVMEIEGLAYGEYRVEVEKNGTVKTGTFKTITVENTAQQQYFTIEISTLSNLYIYAGAVAIVIGVAAACIFKKRKAGKK